MVDVVVLSANGEKRLAKSTSEVITGTAIAKILRKTKAPECIGTYQLEDKAIHLWGYKEGKAGTENKHEMPPPYDIELLFGDAVVSLEGGNLSLAAWMEFYTEAFGGFEELDEEVDGDGDVDVDVDVDVDGDADADADADADGDADADVEEDGEVEGDGEDEEVDEDDDCYDDGEEAGGGSKRRAPRRKTAQTVEYRRIDMGLKARIKLPGIVGKRAPRWQTEEELQQEEY